jgi:hypothetical protein
VFTDLFGADLIVVPGHDVPAKVGTFHRRLAENASPAGPAWIPTLELPLQAQREKRWTSISTSPPTGPRPERSRIRPLRPRSRRQ